MRRLTTSGMPLSDRVARLALGRGGEADFVTAGVDEVFLGSADLRLAGSKGIGLRVESSDAFF